MPTTPTPSPIAEPVRSTPLRTLTRNFGADYQPSLHAVAATLVLTGTADPTHQTASLDLIVNGTDHQFRTAAASDAAAAVTAVVAALSANNWPTLYGLSDLQTHTALTAQQYTALGSSSGTFSQVTTDGAITYTTSSADIRSASVPFTATLTSPTGTPSTEHGLIEMIDTTQGWQLYSITGPDTANASAPVSARPSAPPSAIAAPGTVTLVPVVPGPSTYALPPEPSPVWIAPLPLSAGPDEATTPGMRLSYSLDAAGFEASTEVWEVTFAQRDADGTRVVLQEQAGRTPGLDRVIEILPNDALELESFYVPFNNGGKLTRTSGAIDVPAPTVLTTTSSSFHRGPMPRPPSGTQFTVSAVVHRLGAQRIVVPAGTYDADVVPEDVSYDLDGSHYQLSDLLYLVPGIGMVKGIEQSSIDGGQPRLSASRHWHQSPAALRRSLRRTSFSKIASGPARLAART